MCLLCEHGVRFAEEEVRMDVRRLAKLISQARLNTHAVQDWEGLLFPPLSSHLHSSPPRCTHLFSPWLCAAVSVMLGCCLYALACMPVHAILCHAYASCLCDAYGCCLCHACVLAVLECWLYSRWVVGISKASHQGFTLASRLPWLASALFAHA